MGLCPWGLLQREFYPGDFVRLPLPSDFHPAWRSLILAAPETAFNIFFYSLDLYYRRYKIHIICVKCILIIEHKD